VDEVAYNTKSILEQFPYLGESVSHTPDQQKNNAFIIPQTKFAIVDEVIYIVKDMESTSWYNTQLSKQNNTHSENLCID
jgi:hypothetical protein